MNVSQQSPSRPGNPGRCVTWRRLEKDARLCNPLLPTTASAWHPPGRRPAPLSIRVRLRELRELRLEETLGRSPTMSLRLRRVAVCWLCLETGLLFRVGMLHVARGEVKG